MDYQQQEFAGSNDGFYNTNYEQNYGYNSNQQQKQPFYDQTPYDQQQYSAPQPQVFSPNFAEPPKVGVPNSRDGSYTNFDDEPPLLEGNLVNFRQTVNACFKFHVMYNPSSIHQLIEFYIFINF